MKAAAEGNSGLVLKMGSWRVIIMALLAVVVAGMFAAPARADLANCDQLRQANPWQFFNPLMRCFTDPDPQMQPTDPFGTQYGAPPTTTGLIPTATINFMKNTKSFFMPAITAMATFLIAWFGYKLMMGDAQNVKGDTFTILFKIAGVYFFLAEAPVIYNYMLQIMLNLNQIINDVVNKAGGLFCTKPDLWQRFDCLMVWLAGAGGIGLLLIIGLVVVTTAGVGIVVAFAFIYLMVTLFFTIARFAQIYLMAVISLSLMFALGYLFVPLMFFKNTFHFFQKWLALCLAYVLIPVLMYGYMGMMFVALDMSVISGQYSIYHEIFGQKDVAGMSPDNPAVSPANRIKCPDKPTQDDHGQNDTGNSGTGCSNYEHIYALVGTDDAQTTAANKTDSGMLGNTAKDNGIQAMQYRSWFHSSMFKFSTWSNEADLNNMSWNQGQQKTPAQYLFDILYAFLVACLLIYIMYSLLSYIPDLASELVSQGTSAGKNVVKAQVFGEATTKFALELIKETAIGALEGAKTGGIHGAALGAGKAALQKTAEEGAKRANEMKDMAKGEGEGGDKGGDKGGQGGGGGLGGALGGAGGAGGGLGGALGGAGGAGGGLGGALGGAGGAGGGLGGALGGAGGAGGGLGGALGGGGGGGDKGGDKGGGKQKQ
ncbi:MAG TPA: type IV secretion system protein [Rickettsiales bacterium]|nr:type IV secretion system protein [Rickettsiales bacterium]